MKTTIICFEASFICCAAIYTIAAVFLLFSLDGNSSERKEAIFNSVSAETMITDHNTVVAGMGISNIYVAGLLWGAIFLFMLLVVFIYRGLCKYRSILRGQCEE